jgi:hypothetical protein
MVSGFNCSTKILTIFRFLRLKMRFMEDLELG